MKKYLYHVITGQHKGKLPAFIRGALTPLSWIYGVLVGLRGWLYDRRLLRPKRLPCAVLSVGNIVAGGTGKTPTAIWIAKYLQSEGFRVAVLLRGYRRKGEASIAVVSDGKQSVASVTKSGDEATMIVSALPGVVVVVGKDRYAAGRKAIQLWESMGIPPNGILILDDGFQHRRLARDLDIVTIDSTQPFGTGKLLPAGTLREPRSALKRADVLLLTRTEFSPSPLHIKAHLEAFVSRTQIFESRHQPTRLYRLDTGEEFPLDLLKGKRLLAVCGIGNPEGFAQTLSRYAPQCVKLLAFPDHHQYSPKDLIHLQSQASEINADLIVTTQKDAQKLAETAVSCSKSRSAELRFFVLAIELSITADQDAFQQKLRQVVCGVQTACHSDTTVSDSHLNPSRGLK